MLARVCRGTGAPSLVAPPRASHNCALGGRSFEFDGILALGGADVEAARTNEAVMVLLLQHVRAPAGDAAAGKNSCVQLRGYAEQIECLGRIEVKVREKPLFAFHDFFQAVGDFGPAFLAEPLTQFAHNSAHDWDARV